MHTTQTLYLVKEKISQIDQMEFLRKQQQKQQTEWVTASCYEFVTFAPVCQVHSSLHANLYMTHSHQNIKTHHQMPNILY